MKALALRHTRTWFVINGCKDIENRSLPTRLRERIWIHASSAPVTKAAGVETVDCLTELRSF
jgi:hypothetical protein